MHPFVSSAALPCLVLTALAAFSDARSGLIPNWLTLPCLGGGLLLHGLLGGGPQLGYALLAAVVCAFVPLVLFRAAAIGGGDVKLFAALGALAGVERGLEVQLGGYLVATLYACCLLAYRGTLLATLGRALRLLCAALSPRARHARLEPAALTSVRLGVPVFVAYAALALTDAVGV